METVMRSFLMLALPVFGSITMSGCSSEPPKPTLDVSAKQLVKAYKDNEIAADERYEDKVVRIKGKVESIDKGVFGGLSVTLDGGFLSFGNVVCEFGGSETDSLSKLKKGESVTVVGRVTGRTLNSGQDVNVEDCRIE